MVEILMEETYFSVSGVMGPRGVGFYYELRSCN